MRASRPTDEKDPAKGVMRRLKSQRGFTLVEVLVALGIMSAIGSVLVGTLHQMTNFTSRSNAQVSVSADLRNAFHWMAEDMKMANTTDLVDGAPAVSTITLNWTNQCEGASTPHSANYCLVGTELRRTSDGSACNVGTTHTVARNVASVEFSLASKLVTVALTSTDDKWSDVTKQFSHYFYLYSSS